VDTAPLIEPHLLLRDVPARGVFRPPVPDIRPDRMLRLQGYRAQSRIRPQIRAAAENAARVAQGCVTPVLHFRRVGIDGLSGPRLALADGSFLTCEAFARHLQGCSEVVVFVLTLGPALDARVVDLADGFDLLDALFLEAAGWLAVEGASKVFGDALRRWAAAHGRGVTLRMGPGYAYRVAGGETRWALEDQRALFQVFSGEQLPVRLLDSCAMQPKMSRSGLYGITTP
jgi:hypothetical protein